MIFSIIFVWIGPDVVIIMFSLIHTNHVSYTFFILFSILFLFFLISCLGLNFFFCIPQMFTKFYILTNQRTFRAQHLTVGLCFSCQMLREWDVFALNCNTFRAHYPSTDRCSLHQVFPEWEISSHKVLDVTCITGFAFYVYLFFSFVWVEHGSYSCNTLKDNNKWINWKHNNDKLKT